MFDLTLDHKIAPFKLLLVEGVEANVEIEDVEAKAIVKVKGVDDAITLEQEASLSNNQLSELIIDSRKPSKTFSSIADISQQ